MSISIHKKGFTLIELMIVIAIIGILVAGLYPSLTGYLARGRDATKINEIAQLNTALVLYQVANKTYNVVGFGGGGTTGQGPMNFSHPNASITNSVLTGLQEKGFLNKSIKNNNSYNEFSINTPYPVYNIAPCRNITSGIGTYLLMLNDSTGKYSISAYLENPQPTYISNIFSSYGESSPVKSCTIQGHNYAVGIN